MKQEYMITDILHSGRKGIRGERVTDPKYEDLVGSTVVVDFDNTKQYERVHLDIKYHPIYEWWNTSDALSLSIDREMGRVELETANTIYIFDEIRR